MARGDLGRVAYLSLTRGEGGQNVIGTELFDALGVIRTEELLQARRLDGGDQFFTQAFDYGFSKTVAEAASFWGEQDVLRDMVREIIREELQGGLGERITRNIRKLVRAEMARALATQTMD